MLKSATALTTQDGGVICGSAGSTQLNCPHDDGVCCNDGKSCCPSQYSCVLSGAGTQCRQLTGSGLELAQARESNRAENDRRAAQAKADCAAAGGSCAGAGAQNAALNGLNGLSMVPGSPEMQAALTPVTIIHQAPPPPKITLMPTIIIQHKPADMAAWQAANAAKCASAVAMGGAAAAAAAPSVPLVNAPAAGTLDALLAPKPVALLEKAAIMTDEEATQKADAFLAKVDTVKTAHMIARLKRAGVHSTILDKIVQRAKDHGRDVNEIKEMVQEDAFEDAHDPPSLDEAIKELDTTDANLQKFSEQRSSYATSGC
jgi:hypothetical protein